MNRLSKETSPYLLQHQNNPVNWFAWNDEAWDKARAENKLVLISIGYSACHWCHVMEHEVFEDNECAEYMNQHFVCIKVDREERPDVDSIYMDAVHLMGGRGGWPLNVFVLPDGRPVFGGTYFPKIQWLNTLGKLVDISKVDAAKLEDYAFNLHSGLSRLSDLEMNHEALLFNQSFIDDQIKKWSLNWDLNNGGSNQAPKFPMPNNLEFLLQMGVLNANDEILSYVDLTLRKMALGGIFDQAGGGFARYSVDDIWKVPHFEKMLYDNAQLICVYSQAYRRSRNPLFLRAFTQTIEWAEREMKSPEGLFYSALDADSEGVEGKFYTWSEVELKEILGDDYEFAVKYFGVSKEGLWEHNQNILLCQLTDDEFSFKYKFSIEIVVRKRLEIVEKLMQARSNRIRPGLDDKCITSWNSMMISAFVEAFRSTGNENYLKSAEFLFESICKNLIENDGKIFHCFTKNKPTVGAFLDDYAFLAKACIDLYEAGFNERHLFFAKELSERVISLFADERSGMFYFSSKEGEKLITRKIEVQDNVIPSSNSVMANVLFSLSRHFEDSNFEVRAEQMLRNIAPQMNYASGYSNWLILYTRFALPFREVVATGDNAVFSMKEIQKHFIPNCLFAASTNESGLPLFMNRFGTKSEIYVCIGKTCSAPLVQIEQVLQLIN